MYIDFIITVTVILGFAIVDAQLNMFIWNIHTTNSCIIIIITIIISNSFVYLLVMFILSIILNSSEIPSELSRENVISSHLKITYYRSYGCIINSVFCSKNEKVWYSLVFI